jgi:transcriptional regulator with XRE-family HTH domain
MNLLSQQLRKKRMEKGLQAKEMAYALKMTASAYSRIENGKTKVSYEMAQKIAEKLGSPINELFDTASSNYDIKNGNNSPIAIENSTLILQSEKLIETVLMLAEQVAKNNEQQLLMMHNQNEILKEVVRLKKVS